MKGARAVGRHFDPAPARHGPGRVIAAAQGLGGANAAPKWWVFVPVPEERTKREPFCSAPPTTKLQARPGVGRRRLPSAACCAARRCAKTVGFCSGIGGKRQKGALLARCYSTTASCPAEAGGGKGDDR